MAMPRHLRLPRPLALLFLLAACGVADAEAGWRSRAVAPSERSEVAAAVSGGRVFVVGGFRGDGGTLDTVEVYDPRTDTWTVGPRLPIGVNHPMASSADGRVYVFGGYLSSGAATDRAFTLVGGRWRELPRMPEVRAAGGAAAVGNMIYVVGGVGPAGLGATTMVFETATRSWTTVAGLPTPREHLGVTSQGGLVYAVGGRTGGFDTNLAATEAFDPSTGTWTILPDMPTPRGGMAAAAPGSHFVVAVGGEGLSGTFEEVEAFDVETGTWATFPALPTPRHGLGATAVGRTLFALAGGTVPGLSVSDVNECLLVP